MSLKTKLQDDLKNAMKASNATEVGVLRLVISAIKNKEIEKKTELLPDADVLQVLNTEAKKRKDSIEAFVKASRSDLADKEKAELAVIQKYLPAQMSREEVEKAVERIVETLRQAQGDISFGNVMKAVMAELRGKADSTVINEAVKKLL